MSVKAPLPVYVLHWNAPDRLMRSLGSISSSVGVPLRLTVVDNGSDPDLGADLEQQLPSSVRLIRLHTNTGYSGAANAALADHFSNPDLPDLIVLAAHDLLTEANCLSRLASAAASHPDFGLLGPAHHGRTLDGAAHWIGGRFLGAKGAPFARPPASLGEEPDLVIETDWVPGMLMCFRTDCMRQVGSFDEQLFAYWEDVDISLRVSKAGWRVGVVPAAVAAEQGYSSSVFNQSYFVARNRILVVGKFLGVRRYAAAARVAGRALSAWIGSCLPTRTAEHRRRSRAHAAGRWAGVRDGVRRRGGPPPSPGRVARDRRG